MVAIRSRCRTRCGSRPSDFDLFGPELYGVKVKNSPSTKKKGGTPRAVIDPTSTDNELLSQVVEFYSLSLPKNAAAIDYLTKRGLNNGELMEEFQLGFADRSLGLVLPARNLKAGKELRQRLVTLGILRNSGHERCRGAATLPLFDEDGRVVQLYGRMVGHGLRRGVPLHTWLHPDKRGLFNLAAFASKSIVVTASLMDAITLWANGCRTVTAIHGVDGPTDELIAAIEKHETEKVLLAFRRNETGDAATEELAGKLNALGVEVLKVQLPLGVDVNEFAMSVKDAPKALGQVLRSAIWMGSGKGPELPAEPRAAEDRRATIAEPEQPFVKASDARAPVLHLAPAPPTAPSIPTEVKDEEVIILLGNRRYRIRGLERNTALDCLKVNVLVSKEREGAMHVDVFDLYSSKQRAAFITQAARELGEGEEAIRGDLARVLFKLEELQEQNLKKELEPQENAVTVSEEDTTAALELLKAPDLLDRVLADFEKCGLVGEADNKLVAYLASISRKLDEPLAIIVQSTSAAGKTSLMDAVLAFVPPEDRQEFSALTGQSLFYLGERGLAHKVLAIAEEEGASKATYALKVLQSEGGLSIASTGKDSNGRLVAQEYKVTGPVALFTSTTAVDLDAELANRCLLLTVNEEREQTRAIHQRQREAQTLEGLVARKEREEVLRLQQNAQRLLRPLAIVNPFAPKLTFLDGQTRTRRDHLKYLGLIKAVALLHQHQREVKLAKVGTNEVQYVEVTLADIAISNRLADSVLGRSLDEVPPHTRKLLLLVDEMVTKECEHLSIKRTDFRFTRRDAREHLGWSDTALKIHLRRLVELEYLARHRGHGRAVAFELLFDGRGKDGQPFMSGLLDLSTLGYTYDAERSGQTAHRSGCGQPLVSPRSGGGQGGENGDSPNGTVGLPTSEGSTDENARLGGINFPASYAPSEG